MIISLYDAGICMYTWIAYIPPISKLLIAFYVKVLIILPHSIPPT